MTTTRTRIILSLVLAGVMFIVGLFLALPNAPLGDGLVRGSYDSLHQISGEQAGALSNSPVVIVYLDLNSFGLLQQDPAQPWSRELHAKLLGKLTQAGAKAVVFDIVFSAPGKNAAADDDFTAALQSNKRTILAGESSGKNSTETQADREWVRASTISPPYERFVNVAAGWGVASHIMDDDYVVRRYVAGGFSSEQHASLTWATAKMLALPLTKSDDAMTRANGINLRYYGPPLAIPHVSYADALSTDSVLQNFFRDKIVFIGARPLTEFFRGRQDEFRSPFHSWANRELFHPGVEVHATELLNLLRGDGLNRSSVATESTWLFLAAVIFGGGLIWLRPMLAAVVALVGITITLVIACWGFDRGVWFPWQIIAAVQIPLALGGSVLFRTMEWYRARRRYESRIREQAALIDKAHDAILVADLRGKIVYANPSAEKLYGWASGELRRDGASEELFSADVDSAKTARAKSIEVGEWNGELKLQTKSGRIVIVASRWTLIRDAAGKPKSLLQLSSDITDQKQLEQQFLRTQRMNTIGTLAGGMAHDLNNALAPILMGTQLLRRRSTDDEVRSLLTLMETNTQRGADMVRQILLFARGRGGEFEPLRLGALIKELEKMVRETFARNIALETFIPADLWTVRGNSTQIHQVLMNLCVNARDAMPAGGKLTIAGDNVQVTAEEAAQLSDVTPGKFVCLMVSDTGTGMSPEVRAKIFEPFFTTKSESKGTGIGLATVQRIVKAHGGFLRVESQLGEGASFEFYVPCAFEVESVQKVAILDAPRGNNELLLLADDEQAIRDLMAMELRSSGYRVVTAANGAEAVSLFRQHADDVRLFITDSSMPVMDGLQAVKELRAERKELPVIFTSGQAEDFSETDVMVLNKPFAVDELLVAISAKLRDKRV